MTEYSKIGGHFFALKFSPFGVNQEFVSVTPEATLSPWAQKLDPVMNG